MRKSLVLLMVCALVFLAFTASASAAKKARPIHGYMVGTVTFSGVNPAPPPAPPWLWATSDAVGDVSHMGDTVLWAKHPAAMDFGSNDMKFTAANGDIITCSYHGGGALPPNPGDWYDLWTEITITGGTGRFAGAEGDMTATVHLRFLPMDAVWPAIWVFTGTIKY